MPTEKRKKHPPHRRAGLVACSYLGNRPPKLWVKFRDEGTPTWIPFDSVFRIFWTSLLNVNLNKITYTRLVGEKGHTRTESSWICFVGHFFTDWKPHGIHHHQFPPFGRIYVWVHFFQAFYANPIHCDL